jgi:hypothetical protein
MFKGYTIVETRMGCDIYKPGSSKVITWAKTVDAAKRIITQETGRK